jgi:hypothetical protein
MTPIQRAAAMRRFLAAEDLERARQVIRENQRYGYPISKPHGDAVHQAEQAYDEATRAAKVVLAA